MLGVAQAPVHEAPASAAGAEPSLFFAVSDANSTLSAEGWFLGSDDEFFELSLFDPETDQRLDTLIVRLDSSERAKQPWKTPLTLEVKRRGL